MRKVGIVLCAIRVDYIVTSLSKSHAKFELCQKSCIRSAESEFIATA